MICSNIKLLETQRLKKTTKKQLQLKNFYHDPLILSELGDSHKSVEEFHGSVCNII